MNHHHISQVTWTKLQYLILSLFVKQTQVTWTKNYPKKIIKRKRNQIPKKEKKLNRKWPQGQKEEKVWLPGKGYDQSLVRLFGRPVKGNHRSLNQTKPCSATLMPPFHFIWVTSSWARHWWVKVSALQMFYNVSFVCKNYTWNKIIY